MKQFSIISAYLNKNNGIGFNNVIPWEKIDEDMRYFTKITTGNNRNVIIMGRKTWQSIPQKNRPLKNRLNIVISNKNSDFSRYHSFSSNSLSNISFILVSSFQNAISIAQNMSNIDDIFVIGGEQVYREAIKHNDCSKIYITEIYSDLAIECDTYFPNICSNEWNILFTSDKLKSEQNPQIELIFKIYSRSNISLAELQISPALQNAQTIYYNEQGYLDLTNYIINNGTYRNDRTNIGTFSIFGAHMRFSLENDIIPVFTTKKIFWRGVVEELLWFISGSTNSNDLHNKGIYFWDANGSRSFLDKQGLKHRKEGDLGPTYGFQWRHFGAKYIDCDSSYKNKGIDQLNNCINLIKNDPNSRRIIMSAWNPSDLSQVALPPCHIMCQFYVSNIKCNNSGELSCLVYQRSADMGLGIPFNIASYSLLTKIIANICNLKTKELIYMTGDTHVYSNHINALKIQTGRVPKNPPILKIVKQDKQSIESYKFSDFELINYYPDSNIYMEMAV